MKFYSKVSNKHKIVVFYFAKSGYTLMNQLFHFLGNYDSKDIIEEYDPKKHEKFYKILLVRNTWTRLVSCYTNKISSLSKTTRLKQYSGLGFEEFIKTITQLPDNQLNEHFCLQIIPHQVDTIWNLENAESDIKNTFNRMDISEKVNIFFSQDRAKHKHIQNIVQKVDKTISTKPRRHNHIKDLTSNKSNPILNPTSIDKKWIPKEDIAKLSGPKLVALCQKHNDSFPEYQYFFNQEIIEMIRKKYHQEIELYHFTFPY